MKLSLPMQLRAVAGLFFLMALVGAGSVLYLLARMADDGRVVNHAGIVRGGSQRLVKLELAGQPADKLAARLELIIHGLVEGNPDLKLPRAADPEFKARMAAVAVSWGELKTALAAARSRPQDRDALLARSEAFFDTADRAVTAAEVCAGAKVRQLKMAQGLVLGANLLLGLWVATRIVGGLIRTTRAIVESIGENAQEASTIAAQVAQASHSLAEGAAQQAAALEETSASLEEISAMTKRNAEDAGQARGLATAARSAADNGARDLVEMQEAMQAIRASSDDIAKILRSIDEIAFQTNILSLNAAVEAARAGDSGAGFAVVADEVRNLARRSAEAARETAGKVDEAKRRTARGVEVTAKASVSLQGIVDHARQVEQLVAGIATASEQQNQGVAQINDAVSRIDGVTQSGAAGAEETASAAGMLSSRSASLESVVTMLSGLVGLEARRSPGNGAPRGRAGGGVAGEPDLGGRRPQSAGAPAGSLDAPLHCGRVRG